MEKAYKYRIYPSKKQKDLLTKTFGCCRFIYNYFLNRRIEVYQNEQKSLTYNQCSLELTKLKQELEWLREPDKCALQNTLKDLENAYKKFFKEHTGFPKFKSKKTHRFSYRTSLTGNNIAYCGNHIKLPKLGMVKTRNKLVPQGRILNATVSQEPSGKYYVSLCCTDIETNPLPKTNESIGIDLGIKEYCTFSDGVKVSNPKYLKKSLDKLAKLQSELSRKSSGSNNRNKARIKVARMYEKITNQRKDFLQKLSTDLIQKYDLICVEDLHVKDMIENQHLSREISDVSWSEFVRMLEYKAKWYGKKLVKVDQYFASSQKCCICGHPNEELKKLTVRNWICPQCGTVHDRDINASINILNEARRTAGTAGIA